MNLTKIKNLIREYHHWLDHFRDNVIRILFFGMAAIILGQGIPDLYFKYFDNTTYYSITSPLPVEGTEHHPGDEIVVEINRESLITTDAISVTELVLYSQNMEIDHFKRDLALTVGKETIHAIFFLPTNLKPGNYYYRGVVSYKVRGIDKSTPFYTQKFDVTQ